MTGPMMGLTSMLDTITTGLSVHTRTIIHILLPYEYRGINHAVLTITTSIQLIYVLILLIESIRNSQFIRQGKRTPFKERKHHSPVARPMAASTEALISRVR